jgi:hypothetical protein
VRDLHVGRQRLGLAPSGWRGAGAVATRRLRPGVQERVTSRSGDVEWDVVLDRPLPADGDVHVEAAVDGTVGAPVPTGSRLRWTLDDGGAASMGQVVVRDAVGRELHRALPHGEPGRVRLDVPAEALRGAQYPVTVDPVIGVERPVSGTTTAHARPDIAFAPGPGGTGTGTFFTVWEERAGGDVEIFGGEVDVDSGRRSGFPGQITDDAVDQRHPTVAFRNGLYLAVWQDARNGGADVFGQFFDTTGVTGDAFPISTATGDQTAPSVGPLPNGDFLVAWEDRRSGSGRDVYGTRVRFGFPGVLDPLGLAITTAAGDQVAPAVGARSSSTASLVAWSDERSGPAGDVYAARVTTAGVVPDVSGIPVSTAAGAQLRPRVSHDGSRFVVAWEDRRSGAGSDVYASRVTDLGAVSEPAGIAVAATADDESSPDVGGAATEQLVAWERRRAGTAGIDVLAGRLTEGAVRDVGGVNLSATPAEDEVTPAVTGVGATTHGIAYVRHGADPILGTAARAFVRTFAK